MFDLSHLFVSAAMAQDTSQASSTPSISDLISPQATMIILLFAVWFFLVIRPQQKKLDDQNKMIKALQRGDRIVTGGGIHGKISKLEGDDHLMVEIADGVEIKVERSHVQALASKTQPAADSEKK